MQQLSAAVRRYFARQMLRDPIMMATREAFRLFGQWGQRGAGRPSWKMDSTIEFKSHVPAAQRAALEGLLFFNACQGRVSDCIATAVERFGSPEIVADGDRLRIHMKHVTDAQSLFAIDQRTGRPVGVAVYTREDLERITVVHLSLAAEYASGGMRASEQLLLRLLREVRRSTRRMKGVRSLQLFYATRRGAAARGRAASGATL